MWVGLIFWARWSNCYMGHWHCLLHIFTTYVTSRDSLTQRHLNPSCICWRVQRGYGSLATYALWQVYVRWQRGTARITCPPQLPLSVGRAAVDQYLLPTGLTAANMQQRVCTAVNWPMLGQTDRRTDIVRRSTTNTNTSKFHGLLYSVKCNKHIDYYHLQVPYIAAPARSHYVRAVNNRRLQNRSPWHREP